ncbi:LOW QUALITY PROTEIN: hypothetical protein OSB04_016665 [Centaurea solstitialis]|uniref:Uncharacterized protein n=1 Tax=Centaurea solstitialis TaxID=347529 RepID=A0AA38WHN5_9ASTR|nr:LOW QUALITY PROTEIN: hypothetical protein OSB04_016665 [Centaurea solstitialis]
MRETPLPKRKASHLRKAKSRFGNHDSQFRKAFEHRKTSRFGNPEYPTRVVQEFEELMHKRFKMSFMGELTFFLGSSRRKRGYSSANPNMCKICWSSMDGQYDRLKANQILFVHIRQEDKTGILKEQVTDQALESLILGKDQGGTVTCLYGTSCMCSQLAVTDFNFRSLASLTLSSAYINRWC